MDKEKIKEGVKLILEGVGEDTTREGLLETPDRIARMYEELFAGLHTDASEHLVKTFHVDNNEMVIEKDITFYSMCEHHLLPFYGKAHVAYVPDGRGVCKTSADSGEDDRTDCGCVNGVSESERCDRTCRGRAYVYDDAWY